MSNTKQPPSPIEIIKEGSNYLRGSIAQGLKNPITGALEENDTVLTKFHGIYQQDDRDLRSERKKQVLEPAYSFMVRIRLPGGICTPQQWLAISKLSRQYCNQSIRITSRQAIQLHGVLKANLKSTIATINQYLLDTIAACGDVNRNVMLSPSPRNPHVHTQALEVAREISNRLTPATTAYHEIWLDGMTPAKEDHEPIYGRQYLPRKFKISIAVPPSNDVDIFAQDLGFIAIVKNNHLTGFNIAVGGGMGTTHSEPSTYPRLASVIGYATCEQAASVAEQVVRIQRDHGNRSDRKNARLKYTIDRLGLDWFCQELNDRLGWKLKPARKFNFNSNEDDFGWWKDQTGIEHYGMFIPNGRVDDKDDNQFLTAMEAIAELHKGEFRLTPNQNLIISNVSREQRSTIEDLLAKYDLVDYQSSQTRRSMACVALPTCGLAMAEAERYLPDIVAKIDDLLDKYGCSKQGFGFRISGCPNGCSRPHLAEVALIGKAPGRYNLHLGGNRSGQRLNRLYKENLLETEILTELEKLLTRFAKKRNHDEDFADYLYRSNTIPSAMS